MTGKDRVLEDEPGRLFEKPVDLLAAARQAALTEKLADLARRPAGADGARALRREKIRDPVDEAPPRLAKLLRRHFGGLVPEPAPVSFAAQFEVLSRTSS